MSLKNTFKKTWMKYVRLWNEFVIQVVLIVIWFFVLTPTAVIRRGLLKVFYRKQSSVKKVKTFYKKSDSLDKNHFVRPF